MNRLDMELSFVNLIHSGGKRGPAAAEEAGPELMLKMKKRKENRVDGNSDSSKKKTRKEKRLDGDSDCSKKESRKEKTSEGDFTLPFKLLPRIISV